MEAEAFRFEDVHKRYGAREALQGLTLASGAGGVIGFVGANGSGKSTAIRCLMGLQRPDRGRAIVFGREAWGLDEAARQRIGYLSERGVPFPWASADDLIRFCAPRYPRWDRALEERLLERFRIDRSRAMKTLSMGQQRAAGLLLTLAPRPDLLVLDEPASNLDPTMRRAFLDEAAALAAGHGTAVFFSSHVLSDVERVATRVTFLHEGRLRLDRPVADLRGARRIALPEGAAPAPGELCRRPAGRGEGNGIVAMVTLPDDAAAGKPLGLEDLFVELTACAR